MRFLIILSLFFFSQLSSPIVKNVFSDVLTPVEENIYNSIPEHWNLSEIDKLTILYGYFNGLGQGIEWADSFHKSKENRQLYCPPKNEYFYGDKFFQIYKSY